jgi:predicted dehydrogenase/threonine dehydrogenase-like Zn-dependent dehydrogenase
MKQLLQDLRDGETRIFDVPIPMERKGCVVIESISSLLSIGTEKMLIDFGKASWVGKARQQPERVVQVVQKSITDGFIPTLEAVAAKLEQAIPLGYSNVGRVVSVGKDVAGISEGDLVVSNGPHAEVICVEKNLVALVPGSVSAEEACFSIVGSIALQGVRLLRPTLGECFVVTGLGLIGLLTVQILQANGCKVIGIDLDSSKCELARQFGAKTVDLSAGEDPLSIAIDVTKGRGVDGVLIAASTRSNEPIHQGAQMCRKRGRIVLVGVSGLQLSRTDFYEKELSFQVSCSYGPGRYDSNYELKGHDYPYGFVRWTEQRNFEAVLGLMDTGKINVKPLISHRFGFEDAVHAYEQVSLGGALGIILKYRTNSSEIMADHQAHSVPLRSRSMDCHLKSVIAVIGAGGFTRQVLLPSLAKTGLRLKTIVSSKGVSGTQLGQKFGFECSTTDTSSVFCDGEIDIVIITTRHDSHAGLVVKALEAGKRVYVEKPLCLKPEELDLIASCYGGLLEKGKHPFLMVGFNRRFAPQIVQAKELLERSTEPKAMTMFVNAGMIPSDHWTQDRSVGGGRIVGEACHFIDLLRFLAGSPISDVQTSFCAQSESRGAMDSVTILLSFENGSNGTIQYLSNGHKAVSKERLEVYCGGKVVTLDNFRKMKGYGWRGFKKMNLWRQDKGHKAEMAALINSVREGGPSPIPFDEIVEVTRASFQASGILITDYSDGTD